MPTDGDLFFATDHPLRPDYDDGLQSRLRFEHVPMTPERFREVSERMLAEHGEPEHEYHHPQCPKILTKGERACRCGAAPLEAVFEDELADRR
jgi:hypothetical protein